MSNETIVDLLDQPWLRETADTLQGPVRDSIQQFGEVKDFLHGKWLGHALHPVLTDIPVGAWTTALVLDLAGQEDAADLAVGLGLAGALASAVTGITDWSETDGPGKSIGLLHGLLNVAATGFYTASLIARRGNSRKQGIALSLAGYAIASASAYLGGHLVFGEQIGVDHTATPDRGQPEKFTPVIRDDELKERKPVRVDVGDTAVLLVRIDGEVYALANTCTHLGGPLNEGPLEGDSIRCPWHGSRFCLTDGAVLDGPAVYDERVFDVRVRNGQIEVRGRQ